MKVAALYRVSTKKQVRDDDDTPIPAQQKAIADFCESHGYTLVAEYIEPGVSAFKVSADDRDIIENVYTDAKNKLFEMLLIFKNNRLSRRSREYPVILDKLKTYGVTVWEVSRNKRLTPTTHDEDLTTFIDGWQAEGESINISNATHAGKISNAYSGIHNGGPCSYGYRVKDWAIERSGRRTKAHAVYEIDQKEANIIEFIADYYERGFGSRYIAKQLNRQQLFNRAGSEWFSNNIRKIMRNPAIAGITIYRIDGITTKKTHEYKDLYNPNYYAHKDQEGNYILNELAILPLDRWLNIMKIMENNSKQGHSNSNRQKPCLLSGFVRCGYCGKSMSGINYKAQSRTKSGDISYYDRSAYRCSSHLLGASCEGPTQVAIRKIDSIFLEELEIFFSKLDPQKLVRDTNNDKEKIQNLKLNLKRLKNDAKKTGYIRDKWLNEMDEYFARNGDYMFSKGNIAKKIMESENKLSVLEKDINTLQKELDEKVLSKNNIEMFKQIAPNWYYTFAAKTVTEQNLMLKDILESIYVYRNRIVINYKIDTDIINKNSAKSNDYIEISHTISL
ncbi:MAG TPA: recombinase family protein [Syntrophomonadaceae bacterium]|mgnify:CR=1 FL=1|nr:recombinase family protein [Syntrophomonadaceae bacterium]